MARLLIILIVFLSQLTVVARVAEACRFTPLEWQQVVKKHSIASLIGQRKHTTWTRDGNRNFIDDQIELRFQHGEIVDVTVDLNRCLTESQIRELLARFGRIRYIGKLITFVLLDSVRVEYLPELAALPQIAMVEWRATEHFLNDVSTRAIQVRSSNTYSNTAEAAGLTGAGVNIAILDSGVDDLQHESLTGTFVAGFNALNFEDANGNGIDDSCEPVPVGNGSCNDADDEPANGSTNPDDDFGHGTHVAGIALGRGAPTGQTRVCSTPDDASPTNCAGVATGAGLVDIKVGNQSVNSVDVAKGLDWLGIKAQTFNIRVANLSISACTDDDGTSARSQQINYIVSLGVTFVVSQPNWRVACGYPTGFTQLVGPGAAASFATTVAMIDDQDTVTRSDDARPTNYFGGPRSDCDHMSCPNLLALKPDLAAPGRNIVSAEYNTVSGYFSRSGASQAAPQVAGAAAILLEARPTIDPGSLKDLFKRNADRSKNTAWDPAIDPDWDFGLGYGMLNAWDALNAAAAADVGFPNCVGPPVNPGRPCALTPPVPPWNNTLDISTDAPTQVGVPNTIRAQVQNNGSVPAMVLVNFGVYVFAVGNNQFFHIGTQQVLVPAGTTVSVSQPWTPAAANHQCVQVSIDFGLDTNFDNNITQRNLQVAPSVFHVRIENPFMVPARFQIRAQSDRKGWQCRVGDEAFTIDPFQDCPRQVRVTFDPPPGARPGERANCHVAVFATPKGAEKARAIGGVTVQTFVPRPCRLVGIVLDPKGNPVRDARLLFALQLVERDTVEPGKPRFRARPTTALTDRDGVFSLRLTPYLRHIVNVEKPRLGKGQVAVRPVCGIGTLKFVLSQEGVKIVEK